jgi:dTDP-glucose 4,6-dehydratase
MRFLVTGGAGFIGSNFLRFMLDRHPGDRFVNVDLLTYAGQEENLAELRGRAGYQFIHADVTDRKEMDAVFARGFDAVIHFAAESHVDRSISGPDPFVRTNIEGTHALVEASRRHKVRRFIQISSDEVYGPIREGEQADAASALNPTNVYAATKAAADLLVLAAHHTHGFPGLITRCTNNYGPWQHPEKFIPLLITRALTGQELPIYGDGAQVRDWIHVEDHSSILRSILLSGVPGRIYTIAGGQGLRNLDVAQRILERAGMDGARIRHVEDRPGHDRRYALDDQATRSEFAWAPRIGFEEGLESTIEWYRQQRAWWAPIAKTQAAPRAVIGLA